jgi:AcrR family transcriptional regulator
MTTDERPPAERLLAAAEELFGERSYGRTTVADICARAGMATGSFYAYFDSKAEIFAAVVRAINRDLRRAMAMAVEQADDNQRARERACFRAFFDMVSRRPWIDRIVRESEFVAPGVFREYYEQLARGYARGVRVAQLAGEVDARYDPEVVAYVYTGIGNFVGMRWADWTAGGRVPDDVLDDVLELFARGLAPAAEASPRRAGAGERPRSTPLSRTDGCGVLPTRRRALEPDAFPRRSAQTASLLSPGTGAPCGSRGSRRNFTLPGAAAPIRWNHGPFDMTDFEFF